MRCERHAHFSGKNRLAKCEGAYHGNHDAVQISVTPAVGMAGDAESPTSVLMTDGDGRRSQRMRS